MFFYRPNTNRICPLYIRFNKFFLEGDAMKFHRIILSLFGIVMPTSMAFANGSSIWFEQCSIENDMASGRGCVVIEDNQGMHTLDTKGGLNRLPRPNKPYFYRLEGFDKLWKTTENKHRGATDNNLTTGDDVLRINEGHSEVMLNEDGRPLKIIVLAPHRSSWWSYTIHFVLLIGLLLFYVRLKKNKVLFERNVIAKFEHKLLERTAALQVVSAQAETENQAESIYLCNIAHELRTSLNAVLGFSSILKEKLKDSPHQIFIEGIEASGKSLLAIINSVLYLAKIETGKIELQLQPTSVRDLFTEAERIFESALFDKAVEFHQQVSSTVPDNLHLEPNLLREIIFNLCSNACKFTDKGKVSITADASVKNNGTIDLTFNIVDTGKGIAKSDFKLIFKRFAQARGQNNIQYGGTGLGLAITKQLIEMMNGAIKLESKLGLGSHFSFTLPDVEVLKGRTVDEEFNLYKENIAIEFQPKNILLVDDVSSNRQIIINYLDDCPFTIVEAENGLEALQLCETQTFDLILMDIKMPKMGGYECNVILKSHDSTSNIPIVVITSESLKHEAHGEKNHDYDAYLTKPLQKKVLISTLMDLIDYTQEEPTGQSVDQRSIIMQKSTADPQANDCSKISAKMQKAEHTGQNTDGHKTILVVDDAHINLMLTQTLLEDEGYRVIVGCDGKEGLTKIQQYEPDLILLDHQMPKMTGMEMMKALKAAALPLPKVILMTSDDSFALRDEFFRLGGFSSLSKTFNKRELLESISKAFSPDVKDIH
jgi:signal transduction histidine kinase/DNA-binding response OmpR family regulator